MVRLLRAISFFRKLKTEIKRASKLGEVICAAEVVASPRPESRSATNCKDLGEQLRKCQQDTLKEIDSIKLMMHEECQRTLLEAWRRQERMRLLRARRRLKSSVLRGWHLVSRDRVRCHVSQPFRMNAQTWQKVQSHRALLATRR